MSGGIDNDNHGNTTELKSHLDTANADWEITRYSNVDHGFTKWDSRSYDPLADSRSWYSALSLFRNILSNSSIVVFNDVDSDNNGDGDGNDHDNDGHDDGAAADSSTSASSSCFYSFSSDFVIVVVAVASSLVVATATIFIF